MASINNKKSDSFIKASFSAVTSVLAEIKAQLTASVSQLVDYIAATKTELKAHITLRNNEAKAEISSSVTAAQAATSAAIEQVKQDIAAAAQAEILREWGAVIDSDFEHKSIAAGGTAVETHHASLEGEHDILFIAGAGVVFYLWSRRDIRIEVDGKPLITTSGSAATGTVVLGGASQPAIKYKTSLKIVALPVTAAGQNRIETKIFKRVANV